MQGKSCGEGKYFLILISTFILIMYAWPASASHFVYKKEGKRVKPVQASQVEYETSTDTSFSQKIKDLFRKGIQQIKRLSDKIPMPMGGEVIIEQDGLNVTITNGKITTRLRTIKMINRLYKIYGGGKNRVFNKKNFEGNHAYAVIGVIELGKARSLRRRYGCEARFMNEIQNVLVTPANDEVAKLINNILSSPNRCVHIKGRELKVIKVEGKDRVTLSHTYLNQLPGSGPDLKRLWLIEEMKEVKCGF